MLWPNPVFLAGCLLILGVSLDLIMFFSSFSIVWESIVQEVRNLGTLGSCCCYNWWFCVIEGVLGYLFNCLFYFLLHSVELCLLFCWFFVVFILYDL